MATSAQTIRRWLNQGVCDGASHVIIACDTYDHTDYPVYVRPEENVRAKVSSLSSRSMTRVMEVYSLLKDLDAQLSEDRAYHLD